MKLHELKIKAKYFKDIHDGLKTFELRKNDRDYQVGDLIKFNCIDFKPISFLNELYIQSTQENEIYKITYILKDVPEYGLDKDYCILGIKKIVLN